jgi:tetratricopeptide (TPR) repeat protein
MTKRVGDRRLALTSIQTEKERLFENITRLMLSFTRARTVILLLDDFQWADASSIGLLHYLARNSTDSKIMIIMTYNPDLLVAEEKSHPLTDTLRLMNRERLVSTIKMRGLTEAETREMVSILLGGISIPVEVTDMIYQETEGNPFFVEEVVLSLLDQGIVDPTDREDPIKKDYTEIAVPKTMSQVVERRVGSLSKEEREVLKYAGVIGDRFDFDTLSGLSGLPEDKLVGMLDKLMEKGIIVEEEAAEEAFRFPIEHFRRLVTKGMPGSETIKLHNKVADILERKERAEEYAYDLAHHHRKAGNLLDAARWSLTAGERAMRLAATEEAAQQLRNSLGLLDQLPPSKDVQELRARVYYDYGDNSVKIGNYEEAAQNFLYLLETAKELSDDHYLGLAYLGIGRVRSNRGAFPQAKESFVKALEIFKRVKDDINIIHARRAISSTLWREGLFDEAVGELLEARKLATRRGDEASLAEIDCSMGNVYRDMGAWDDSISHFRKGIARLEMGGDPYELATAYNNIGATYRYTREWDTAIHYFDKCIEMCRRILFPGIKAYGLKNKGECLAKRGRAEDLDLADHCCDEAMTIFETQDRKPGIANVHMIRGIIQKFRGDFEKSWVFFEMAVKSGKASHVPDLVADIEYEYALSLEKGGDDERALEHMKKALELFERVGAAGRIERAKVFLLELDKRSKGGGGG